MADTDENGSDGSVPDRDEPTPDEGDRFIVAIHVTDAELQFVVRVPSDIDSGWRDPDEFQRLVEQVTWEILDQESTLRTIATENTAGETVTLGSVRLQPDGTLVTHSLSTPSDEADGE